LPMGEAIGQYLSLAVGVALSPIPIIVVVLMLTTSRARSNGIAFDVGWLIGLGVIGTVVLVIAGPSDASEGGAPADWVSWLKLVLGVLLVYVALKQFGSRSRVGDDVELPKWMGAIEGLKTAGAFGTGMALAANPKNLLLVVGAAVAIAQTGISGAEQAVAYALFAVIGTVGVATPVVIYLVMGDKSAELLARLRDWMGRHSAVIMAVLCLVIGMKLMGDAITSLTG
jgi:Sap, sulfolipid-1-addressing protein